MKYPILLLLPFAACLSPRTDTPVMERKVVCEETRVIFYDAFLGGCPDEPCVRCVDTTRIYQRLHESDPAETVRSHYEVLQ